MDAWQLINETMEQGDAEKMSRLFGKSSEWWHSHGRQPKTDDYHFGTGNVSPVTHFLHYMDQRFAVNQQSAIRLHKAIANEIEARFNLNQPKEISCLRVIRRELRKEAFEAVDALDECEISEASTDDLRRWEKELIELEEKVIKASARIRVEKRARELGLPAAAIVKESKTG